MVTKKTGDQVKIELLEQIGCGVARLSFHELSVEVLYANQKFYDCFFVQGDQGIFFGEENYYRRIYNPIYENGCVPSALYFEYRCKDGDGERLVAADGAFCGQEEDRYLYAFTFMDISDTGSRIPEQNPDILVGEHDKKQQDAGIDSLTGLWNKFAFPGVVNRYIHSGRNKNDAFLYITIDHFMAVNDRYGYKFGDAVLVEIAGFMRDIFKGEHMLGRLSGVKFAMLVKGAEKEELAAMAQRLCASVRDIYVGDHDKVALEARISICNISDNDTFRTLSERGLWILDHMKEFVTRNYVFEDEIDHVLENLGQGKDYINVNSDELSAAVQQKEKSREMDFRAQETWKEENRVRGDFLARMSHEIRTPMNAICGMTDLLLQNGLTGLNYEYAQTIKMASDNLISIVNDILDISKIEAGKLEIIPEEYEMESVVEQLSVLVNGRIAKKNIAFYTDISPDIPKVLYGDEKRIRQIVLNLLSNAAKYTEKGFVKLSVSSMPTEQENEVELTFTVRDSGIGIRREDIGKLFAQFQQVDTRRNRKVEGTGLGLAISRQLAELMGGRITVESEYGKGSVFTLTVRQTVHSFEPCVDIPDKETCVVLVYEPNKYYMQGISQMLDHMEIPACTEKRREDFLQKLKTGMFTHVIFDYNKAFFDVEEMIRKWNHIQFVSMLDNNSYRPKEIDQPNHRFLHKPLTIFSVEKILCDKEKQIEYEKNLQMFVAPDIRILIVDDNPVNLKVAQGLFSSYQCQIDTVTSGFEALERLMEQPEYDMLFIDHMMPELDGVETLQLIRSRLGDYGRNVTAVALTANVLREAQELFAASGFQGFLAKPIVLRLLHELMNELVPEEKKVMIEPDMRSQFTGTGISEEDLERIAMKGVDVETGLRCCGNRIEEYLKVLHVVVADGKNKVRLLQQYAENKEYEAYGIEAHAFKSVAAGIGAAKQSQLAKEHEFAVKDKNYDIIDNDYMKLVNSYKFLLNQIQRMLDKEGNRLHNNTQEEKPDVDENVLYTKIEQIADALAQFERKHAISLVDDILGYRLNKEEEQMFTEVKELLAVYEDEAAEQMLRKFLCDVVQG